MSWLDSFRAKIAANPLLSVLVTAGLGYVGAKYGPQISAVCKYLGQ